MVVATSHEVSGRISIRSDHYSVIEPFFESGLVSNIEMVAEPTASISRVYWVIEYSVITATVVVWIVRVFNCLVDAEVMSK